MSDQGAESPGALAGKVMAVTGAGSGIGLATAVAASRSGARLLLAGRTARWIKLLSNTEAPRVSAKTLWGFPVFTAPAKVL